MITNKLILQKLLSLTEFADLLGGELEFELQQSRYVSEMFVVENASPPFVIARDGSGGEFALITYEGDELLVYATSEGQAGVPAASVQDYLSLLLAAPNWRDLCHYSGAGVLAEMKKAFAFLKSDVQAGDLAAFSAQLGIAPLARPVESLHENLRRYETKIRVRSLEGDDFSSLFNDFTIEQNPFYPK